MKVEKQRNDELQKVADLIEDIKFGMLTSQDEKGRLISRPMAALEMDAAGTLWFFTKQHSGKVAQVEGESPQVNISFEDADDASYVSIAGRAEVLHDRAKIEELWSPMAKPWFKGGKDDPELMLLKVKTERADYWDSNSSKMVRLFEIAMSSMTGKNYAEGDQGTVEQRG